MIGWFLRMTISSRTIKAWQRVRREGKKESEKKGWGERERERDSKKLR